VVGQVGSIHVRVASARQRLLAAGIPVDEAGLDARLLAESVLGWDTARLMSRGDEPEPPEFGERYERAVSRRAHREPLAYVTGEREFWNRSFAVSPDVLVPRPETELIVEAALEMLSSAPAPGAPGPSIVDVGTGSGCIAVTLACERPSAAIVATDCSAAALDVARRNAERYGAGARIAFVLTDILEAVPGPFDMIVANPPYVADGDRSTLEPEVREFEPAIALFAGDDGLSVVRRLVALAPDKLKENGALLLEIGAGQADAVARLISRTPGLTMVGLRRDLRGIPRTVIARRRPPPSSAAA
jgi:release factor glutamine methyltransferase